MDVELDDLTESSWLLRPVNEEVVAELARSIANEGLLQPIVVRKQNTGYEVVFGNHRVEAFRMLGMDRIPAVVRDFTDDDAFVARVSENLVRNAYVDPIEEAKGYRTLVDHGWTINAIGRKIGKCDSYVSERLALIGRLSDHVRSKLADGNTRITPSHAELLSRIRDPDRQNEVAELVERKRLSVRALEGMLDGSPLPRRVTIRRVAEGFGVGIPDDFSKALNLAEGQSLHMYVRGRKLILENVTGSRIKSKTRNERPKTLS